MSFLTLAKSIQDSTPVELYKFTRGNTIYRSATCAANIVYSGETYSARPVKRGKVKQTEDIHKSVIEFTFPRSADFASYYIRNPAVHITHVEIKRGESGDYIPWWKGRVTGVSIKGNTIKLQCESIYTALKRPGLRKLYESSCCNTLYETDCGVSRSAYERFVTITGISGRVVTVSGLGGDPNHYFTSGMIKDPELRRYYISRQVGSDLTLFLYPELSIGDEISIFPGCNQQYSTCRDKFNNSLNFGGFPFMPNKNPFLGSII